MPKAYSLDLRQRVARVVEGGRSCHAAAAHFSVSVSFVVRLMKSLRATGRLAPKPSGGRRHAGDDVGLLVLLDSQRSHCDLGRYFTPARQWPDRAISTWICPMKACSKFPARPCVCAE